MAPEATTTNAERPIYELKNHFEWLYAFIEIGRPDLLSTLPNLDHATVSDEKRLFWQVVRTLSPLRPQVLSALPSEPLFELVPGSTRFENAIKRLEVAIEKQFKTIRKTNSPESIGKTSLRQVMLDAFPDIIRVDELIQVLACKIVFEKNYGHRTSSGGYFTHYQRDRFFQRLHRFSDSLNQSRMCERSILQYGDYSDWCQAIYEAHAGYVWPNGSEALGDGNIAPHLAEFPKFGGKNHQKRTLRSHRQIILQSRNQFQKQLKQSSNHLWIEAFKHTLHQNYQERVDISLWELIQRNFQEGEADCFALSELWLGLVFEPPDFMLSLDRVPLSELGNSQKWEALAMVCFPDEFPYGESQRQVNQFIESQIAYTIHVPEPNADNSNLSTTAIPSILNLLDNPHQKQLSLSSVIESEGFWERSPDPTVQALWHSVVHDVSKMKWIMPFSANSNSRKNGYSMKDEHLLRRGKSHLPLYQLQDRLDYKQALIEIAFMHEDNKLLDLLPPNATKKQQKLVLDNFLEKRPLAGSEYNFPGFNSIRSDGFKAHLVETGKDKEMAQKFATIQCLYANDKELAKQTEYEATGILGKSLSEVLEADSDLALYILFFHQNFPNNLPEIVETHSSMTNTHSIKPMLLHFKDLKTGIDWRLEFLKVALPEEIGDLGTNLSDEQKQAECDWLRDALYSKWDIHIKPLEAHNEFYAAAFQPTFLEYVFSRFKTTIERLCLRLKNNPEAVLPKCSTKELLDEEVNSFFKREPDIWESSPTKEQVEVCCKIAATALFKLSMLEGFWRDFSPSGFFNELASLTNNPKFTGDLPSKKLAQPASGRNNENVLQALWEEQQPNPQESSFYLGVDEYDEPQVFYGKTPFLKRGTYKHSLLEALIKGGGKADIETLQESVALDSDQFQAQVKAIVSDFKKIKPGHILLRQKQGKIRLDALIG